MFQTLLNETKSNNSSSKFDCAKECPCGVPVIPVPDQWLEVMVTGGFKVWHIIFIIIAFIVTMTVVYCCFHRCRIPRTKQEIEADLMRTNLATKFTYHLQELPNEPTTFVEALKKVQEYAEKLEREDADYNKELGARKRMGWLKLKGKGDKQQQDDKDKPPDEGEPPAESDNNTAIKETDVKGAIGIETKPVAEPEPPKVEANGNIQAPATNLDNDNSNSNKKVKTEEEKANKPPKQTHKRRQKPGLARTKATGRTEIPPPTARDDMPNAALQMPNLPQTQPPPPPLPPISPKRDPKRKRKVEPPPTEPPPSPVAPKVLKHKSLKIGDTPPAQQGHHHHVKIDMKSHTLGVDGNSAGK